MLIRWKILPITETVALSESGTRSSGNFILINAHTGFQSKILPITETVALSESGTRSSGNFISMLILVSGGKSYL